ncbi:MAG: hypothetical protein LBQ51_06785 [Desulfovibrio sp.]|nr:hypothetical protein [Desulfovibrio sp.]
MFSPNQGALPALLPFFISAYDFTYATAASLVFALNLFSSIVQPLFGFLADAAARPWIMAAGTIPAIMSSVLPQQKIKTRA